MTGEVWGLEGRERTFEAADGMGLGVEEREEKRVKNNPQVLDFGNWMDGGTSNY